MTKVYCRTAISTFRCHIMFPSFAMQSCHFNCFSPLSRFIPVSRFMSNLIYPSEYTCPLHYCRVSFVVFPLMWTASSCILHPLIHLPFSLPFVFLSFTEHREPPWVRLPSPPYLCLSWEALLWVYVFSSLLPIGISFKFILTPAQFIA